MNTTSSTSTRRVVHPVQSIERESIVIFALSISLLSFKQIGNKFQVLCFSDSRNMKTSREIERGILNFEMRKRSLNITLTSSSSS